MQIAEQGDDWDIYWSFRESVIVIEIIGSRAVTMENMQVCRLPMRQMLEAADKAELSQADRRGAKGPAGGS